MIEHTKEHDEILQAVLGETLFGPPRKVEDTLSSANVAPDSSQDQPSDDGAKT